MKKTIIGILFGLAIGALAMRVISEYTTKPAAAEAEAPEPPKPNPTKFPPAKRDTAGIKLAAPTTETFSPEVKGFGRVLDPTPLLALLAEQENATIAHEGSAKELERQRKLFANDNNASAQAVEAAEAAEARDLAAMKAARMKINSSWGRELSTGSTTGPIATALDQDASLVRLDLLPGDTPGGNPKSATVQMMGSSESYPAEILGIAPNEDPQMQGTSYLAVVRHPLPAGAALRVTLTGPGEDRQALVVPRTAVVYHEGSAWVYVLGEEDTFFRRLVTLGRATGDKVEVTDGITADDQIAIAGAQQILSAELQAGGAADED